MLLKKLRPSGLRNRRCVTLLTMTALLPMVAAAQGAGRAAGLTPTLDSSLTYVDTRRFETGPSQSELTTELRPGILFSSRSGLLRGSASYALGLLHRSRTDPAFEAQHQLSAALTGQLIENLAYVDVSASIGRQSVSAFGQQSVAEQTTNNPNQQEVGTLSITPSLRGRLGSAALYDLRLTASGTNTRKSIAGDSTSTGGSLSLSSASRGALLGWGLSASSLSTDFRTAGDSTNDRVTASLEVNPDVDLSLSLRAGQESSEIGLTERQTSNTWGASARWSPSPRTSANFSTDRRFFGRSHSVSLTHRLPLSSLRFGSVRDVALSANANSLGQPATLYDLFFEQFASQEPDPVLRQQLVLNFLAGLGLDPTATVGGGAINRGPTVQERNDIGWTYSAKRLTLSAQAYASRTRQLDDGTTTSAAGDNNTRQRGYTGSLAYRLTPTATFSLLGSRLMTKPTATQAGTDLKSLGLTLSDRLGRYATAALNARYTVFNSALTPYRETAVGASLGLRF